MTTISTAPRIAATRRLSLPLALRLALRELRGGLSGFYIFITCIALGVGTIATVGTITSALRGSIASQGQALLGGDVAATLTHRRATPQERRVLERFGQVSEVATMRAMARRLDGEAQTLIDLKAVDGAYPLFGHMILTSGMDLDTALRGDSAVVDQSLLDRLRLQTGDKIKIGELTVTIAGGIEKEPDRLGGGTAFGPRVLISIDTLTRTGLLAPGTLIRWRYRVRFPEASAGEAQIAEFRKVVSDELRQSGFRIRDRRDPSPNITRAIRRLSEFLTLVGLAALLVGGIGVAGAVTAFVARKRKVIAAFKALGASGRLTTCTFLIQVLLLAALGITVGLIFGATVPFALAAAFGHLLPIAIKPGLAVQPLVLATAYGLLTALAFILWPLGHAQQVRAAELLREEVSSVATWPPLPFMAGSAASAAALAGAAVWLSEVRNIAALTTAGIAILFALFWALGGGIRRLAVNLRKTHQPEITLALANIRGPAGLVRMVALSLGMGLTLLTSIALIDVSLRSELETNLPEKAPSHFFLGIPKERFTEFERLIKAKAPSAIVNSAPMLRGRIVELAGRPADQIDAPPDAEWVLRGDRGLTFAEKPPPESEIVEGKWWPPGYDGPPLVSFEVELARALGLKLGDTVTINVLGRNVTARIANLRTVAWERLSINFIMIFSPNALKGAPYRILATLNWPGKADSAVEAAILRAMAAEFPTVTAIQVRDVLETVTGILEQIMTAVRIAASITLVAGVIVLAGALATVQHRRIYEAVILKVLGATGRHILAAHMLEYLLIALAIAVFAVALGTVVAFAIVTQIMEIPFAYSVFALLQAAGLAILLMLTFGLIGTLRVLRAKAAAYLRAE